MKTFSKDALDILNTLNTFGHAYIVGGAVRDAVLGRDFSDEDIATDLKDHEVMNILGGKIVYPGTVNYYRHDRLFEITTFRQEGDYADGRHPHIMDYTSNLKEDALRRDFTINALYFDGKQIIDEGHGLDDLKKGIIRFIGNPLKRVEEDRLRVLRALRFASQLGFSIETKTSNALYSQSDMGLILSKERILNEYLGIFSGVKSEEIYRHYFKIFASINPKALNKKGYLLYNALYNDDSFPLDKHTKYIFKEIANHENKRLTLNRLIDLIIKINNKEDLLLILKGLRKEYVITKNPNLILDLSELSIDGFMLKKYVKNNEDFKIKYHKILKAIALGKIENTTSEIRLLLAND